MNLPPVLEAWDAPCPKLSALVDRLEERLAAYEQRKRARTAAETSRYRETLTAVAACVAMIAMSRSQTEGLAVPFGNSDYANGSISISELRRIRDGMEACGLLQVRPAFHDRENPSNSRYTRFYPTPSFCLLLGDLRLADLLRPPSNPIILRSAESTEPPPAEIAASADFLRILNAAYGQHALRLPVEGPPHDPERIYLRRIFKYGYDRVGRLYGGFWIDLPKAVRRNLILDGEQTAELDFKTLHPAILFAREGLPLDFDPYRVPGFEGQRQAGKRNFMRLLNGRRLLPPYDPTEQAEFQDKAEYQRFIIALRNHIKPIDRWLGRGEGLRLQKLDGDLALQVLGACFDREALAYPIHDSFIVSYARSEEVRSIMKQCFYSMFGLEISVSCSCHQ